MLVESMCDRGFGQSTTPSKVSSIVLHPLNFPLVNNYSWYYHSEPITIIIVTITQYSWR